MLFDCDMLKSLSVLFEDVDEGFYDERRGNYDVKVNIRDIGVIKICYVTVGKY
jgi:hypothetical protein